MNTETKPQYTRACINTTAMLCSLDCKQLLPQGERERFTIRYTQYEYNNCGLHCKILV